ncbi:MAG: hypothetical protein QI197_06305 [Candidatus Korarchaeota archaeon]|nr:hypothetical protein [Candidatus Korarchaeota archaeon]
MVVNSKRNELLRKAIHILFSSILLVPMMVGDLIDPKLVYAAALAVGGWIYSVQVKGLPQWLKAGMQIPQPKGMEIVLESFNRLVSLVERDYERRAGWLGALSGLIGVSSSYFLFGSLASYGIFALILTDGLSSMVGISMGRIKIPMADGTLEGTAAGLISYLALLVGLTGDPFLAGLVAISSSVVELYGGEDNIAVPIVSSLVAFLSGAPPLVG